MHINFIDINFININFIIVHLIIFIEFLFSMKIHKLIKYETQVH